MKREKGLLGLVLSLILGFTLVACGESASPQEGNETSPPETAKTADTDETASADEEYNFVFIMQSLANPFYVDMEDGMKLAIEELKEQGITVNCIAEAPKTETSTEDFISYVENAIALQKDAIIITPPDATALIPAVVKATEAEIPVFIVDSRLDLKELEAQGGKVETFIGTNSYEAATLGGITLSEKFAAEGEAGEIVEVAIIEGATGQRNAIDRKEGFLNGIKDFPYMEVVASQTANWEMEEAYNQTQNIMTSNPDLRAIFVSSDMMGMGVTNAVSDAGKLDQITIMTFDGLAEGRQAIKDGKVFADVAQFAGDMGYTAIMSAVQKSQDPSTTFSDEIDTKTVVLTIDNVDTE